MKKLLYLLLIVKLFSVVYTFFSVLGTDLGLAIITLALGVLELALIITVIRNTDNIDRLFETVDRIKYTMSPKAKSETKSNSVKPHIPKKVEVARGEWDCVKCGTINKTGTSHCSNCNAEYSAWTNPTLSPYTEKKYSKWIK